MKLIISLVFAALNTQAAVKSISTDFWSAEYQDNQILAMKSAEDVSADCARYSEFAFDENNYLRGMTAEDLDNARTLPLAGTMKDFYEANFIVEPAERMLSNQTVLTIDPENLDALQMMSSGKLVALSKEFGLSETKAEVHHEMGITWIHIKARDLACDLIQKNIELQARTRYRISLTADAILQLNRFYKQVEEQTLSALAIPGNDLLKAAALGYRYASLFPESSADQLQVKMTMLFRQLFIPGTLNLSENWVELSGKKIISIPKEKRMIDTVKMVVL